MSELRKRNVAFANKENQDGDKGGGSTRSAIDEDTKQDKHRIPVAPKTLMVDRILQSYTKFTISAFNQDRLLKVAQYSLWMISRFYHNNRRDSLVLLSGQISWARYINRFLGLPNALEGIRSGSWGSPKTLGKAMAWAMVLYYPLEHVAYIKWKAPKLIIPGWSNSRLAERASALSCQCWFVYIVLDIIRSALALKERNASPATTRNERLQIVRNALFAFPAVHWSLPDWDTNPWLSDGLVNFLMWLESIVCMYQGIATLQ